MSKAIITVAIFGFGIAGYAVWGMVNAIQGLPIH